MEMNFTSPSTSEQLLPIAYRELRKLANARLVLEFANNTLTPTELVHEAYLRLVDADNQTQWDSKAHFFGAAARAMRRILIDVARKKLTRHRAGAKVHIRPNLGEVPELISESKASDLLLLDQCLCKFADLCPDEAKLIELRFFAGLTMLEVAELLGISRRTAHRRWSFARAQILLMMNEAGQSEEG